MINRRQFLHQAVQATAAAALSNFLPLTSRKLSAKPTRPNIVLIMADDMGFSDLGCYGGEIETPNIDRLAQNGLRFSQFYNNGICVPTRASLLTGLYSQQVGVYKNSPVVYENCVTLGEVLRAAGYRTLMTGKWHAQQTPFQRGFDRHFGLCDGACNYFNPGPRRPGEPEPGRKRYPRRWAIDDKEYQPYAPEDPNFYTTNVFTDYALQYLDQYGQDNRPLFLYLAYTAPHYPLHALPEDIQKYRGKYLIGWDKLREERWERIKKLGLFDQNLVLPARDDQVTSWAKVENKDEWDLKMAVYAAMIDRLDQNIGRVLAKLKELGKMENTLILFLSDNGGCSENPNSTPTILPGPVESYRGVEAPWANASNTPFRKYKASDFEGGICTPFIAHWPAVIKSKGKITDQVGHILDIMATCLDIAGAAYPKEFNGKTVLPLEGKSLFPIFQGTKRSGHESLFWQIAPEKHRAVRSGKWKLISISKNDPWELYDLEKDRFEMNNLAEQMPEKVSELIKKYEAWVVKVGMP